ncbi:MAG: hypothetical protein WCN95_04265 [bacterium]
MFKGVYATLQAKAEMAKSSHQATAAELTSYRMFAGDVSAYPSYRREALIAELADARQKWQECLSQKISKEHRGNQLDCWLDCMGIPIKLAAKVALKEATAKTVEEIWKTKGAEAVGQMLAGTVKIGGWSVLGIQAVTCSCICYGQ